MPVGKDLITQMDRLQILPNSLAIWGLGQMGVAIKGPEGILYIDPCLSDVTRELFGDMWARGFLPPVLPTEVTNATYFISSHEHIDHLDPQTARGIYKASPDVRFMVTGWSLDILAEISIPSESIIVPETLQPMILAGTSARLTAIPCAHYEKEHDDHKGYRWLGYLIEWNGVTFFHAGDTIIYPGYTDMLRELPQADVAILPTNGRDWYRESDLYAIGNLWPHEAARLASDLGWDVLIFGHNDLFPKNAIPMSTMGQAIEQVAPRQKYKVLQPGELLYYVK